MKMNRLEILKVLVGSHAHGLATEKSDYNYRVVYITPTSELLKLGVRDHKDTSWIEGKLEDNTAYEIGHFLHLATKSNQSILEVFKAPIVEMQKQRKRVIFSSDCRTDSVLEDGFGQSLRDLFPYVWSSVGVYDAFKGYSHNQQKKSFQKRRHKYAVAHLRMLLQGIELLRTGDFSVTIRDKYDTVDEPWNFFPGFTFTGWNGCLRAVREGALSVGEIVNAAEYLKEKIEEAYKSNPNKQVDVDRVNEFLLKVRKECW